MISPDPEAEFQRRLAAVGARLRILSQGHLEGTTEADPATGGRWEAGEVWAHLAEFLPYWISQAERVLAEDSTEPVAFGRTRANPDRLAAIERDRHRGITALWHDIREDLNDLRAFLGEISERGWRAKGLHPTQGVMPISQIVEQMLIGHLEEHAAQLERMWRG
ncbi:MAG: hypothetical protein ACLQT7_06060 [Candidatus Dormibacteria bacterium]